MAPMERTYDHFWDGLIAAHRRHPHFIVDRCHLSNMVYGDLQGSGLLNPSEWWMIDRWFVNQGAWLFLMTDDVFRVEYRVQTRGREIDKPLDRPQLAQIQRRFETAYHQSEIETKGQHSLAQFFETSRFTSLLTTQSTPDYEHLLGRVKAEINR